MSQSSFVCTQLNGFKNCYLIPIIQINQSFVCIQLNDFKFRKWLNISIRHIDGTLTIITILGQSGPGSNSNEGVLHIPQSSRTETLPSDGLVSYLDHSLWEV